MRDEAGRLVDWAAPGHESVCGVTTQVFRRALCPAPDSWSPLLNSRPDEVFLVLNGTYAEPKIRSGPASIKGPNKGERHVCISGQNRENGQKYIKADALAGWHTN